MCGQWRGGEHNGGAVGAEQPPPMYQLSYPASFIRSDQFGNYQINISPAVHFLGTLTGNLECNISALFEQLSSAQSETITSVTCSFILLQLGPALARPLVNWKQQIRAEVMFKEAVARCQGCLILFMSKDTRLWGSFFKKWASLKMTLKFHEGNGKARTEILNRYIWLQDEVPHS